MLLRKLDKLVSYNRQHCKRETENLKSAYCYIKLLRKVLGVKKNLSNFMIKKLLLKDKFKRLDEENRDGTFFDLLSYVILEPEIQNVFRGKIGLSSEGFEILDTGKETEQPTTWNPAARLQLQQMTRRNKIRAMYK